MQTTVVRAHEQQHRLDHAMVRAHAFYGLRWHADWMDSRIFSFSGLDRGRRTRCPEKQNHQQITHSAPPRSPSVRPIYKRHLPGRCSTAMSNNNDALHGPRTSGLGRGTKAVLLRCFRSYFYDCEGVDCTRKIARRNSTLYPLKSKLPLH